MRSFFYLLSFVTLAFYLSACEQSPYLPQLLSGADTIMMIRYKPDSSQKADTVLIQDKEYILQILYGFGNKDIPTYKCGYAGRLIFQKKRVNFTFLEMEFKLSQQCDYISFMYEGKLYTRNILREAKEILEFSAKYPQIVEIEW